MKDSNVAATVKLYYDDPYLTHTEARIVSVQPDGKGRCLVLLDRTLFYPEGGGQPADRGEIEGRTVLDVQKTADGQVLHTVAAAPPEVAVPGPAHQAEETLSGEPAHQTEPSLQPGRTVQLKLDWNHRFEYMQQHTGQHLLSAMLKREADANTVSVRQAEEFTAIEVDRESLAAGQLRQVVDAANAAIQRNLPVSFEWLEHTRIDQTRLRRPTSITGMVRLVRIQGVDCVACAGVHTASTGELGVIRLCGSERIRGRLRLQFRIGKRASDEYVQLGELADDLVQRYSTPIAELHARILKQEEQLRLARQEMDALQAGQGRAVAARIAASGTGEVIPEGQVFEFAARELGSLSERPVLILSPVEAGVRWAIIYPDGSRKDVASFLDNEFPGSWKGGGKTPLFQGIIAGADASDDKLQQLPKRFADTVG